MIVAPTITLSLVIDAEYRYEFVRLTFELSGAERQAAFGPE